MSTVTSYWLGFFRDTGLPENISKKYAVMFSNERIDPSMLAELSKDILKDIGITTMGDIISILRHARATLDKDTQDKALEGVVRATPAGRTIAHYVGSNSKRKEVVKFRSVKEPNSESLPPNDLPPLRRRVTPEIEGSYKIIMPKGTTPKTRAILRAIEESKKEKEQSMVADKTSGRSVFDRLALKGGTDNSQKSSVTFTRQRTPVSMTPDDNSSSIFRRLGPRNAEQSSSSSKSRGVTEYAGVLKLSAGTKRRAGDWNPEMSTASPEKRARMPGYNFGSGVIRAEATSTTHTKSDGIFSRAGTGLASLSAKQRLGLTSSSVPEKRVKRMVRPATGLRSQSRATGVKSRLGVKTGGAQFTNW